MGYEDEFLDAGLWQAGGKVSHRYRGLENMGNTCYFNAFMQALYMTKKFRTLIHSIANDPLLPNNQHKIFALFNLFEGLGHKEVGQLEPFRPDYFRS